MEVRGAEKGGFASLSRVSQSKPVQFGYLLESLRVAMGGVHTTLACSDSHQSLIYRVEDLADPASLLGVSYLSDDDVFRLDYRGL